MSISVYNMLLRTCFEHCFYSKDFVTLQIVYFLSKMNYSALESLIGPKILEVTCVMRNTSDATRCRELHENPDLANEIQDDANVYLMAFHTLMNGTAAVSSLAFGAWMDRSGRKIPMIVSGSGVVVAMLIYIMGEVLGNDKMTYILFGAAIQGMFGRTSVFNVAVNSYVTLKVENKQRTKLLTNVTAAGFLGSFIGAFAAGFFQREISLFSSLIILEVIVMLTLVLTCVFVPKTHDKSSAITTKPQMTNSPNCVQNITQSIKVTLKMVFQKRPVKGRLALFMFILIPIANLLSNTGFLSVLLLYVTKAPLSWSDYMYSFSKGAYYAAMGLASLLLLPLLIRLFKSSDDTVLIIGLISKVIGLTVLGVSVKTWVVYIGIAIFSCNCFIFIAIKAILSKVIETTESGKLFALVAAMDIVTKGPGNVFALYLYSQTESVFRGMVFFVEAALCIPVLGLVLIILARKGDNPPMDSVIEPDSAETRQSSASTA